MSGRNEQDAEALHEEMESLLAAGLVTEALRRLSAIDWFLTKRKLSAETRVWLLNVAARAQMEVGQPEATRRLERALRIARRSGNRTLEGITLLNLGADASYRHDIKRAGQSWFRALEIFGDLQDSARYAQALMNMLGLLIDRKQFGSADSILSELLPMLKGARDPWGRFGVYLALGHLRAAEGDPAAAADAFRFALAAANRTGEEPRIAAALQNLGSAYLDQGQVKRATSTYLRALSLSATTSPTRFRAEVLRGLALAQFRAGNTAGAEASLREARGIARRVRDRAILADATSDLGALRIEQRKWAAARHYLVDALQLRNSVGDRDEIARSLSNLAVLDAHLNRHSAAAALLESAAGFRERDSEHADLLTDAGDMWLNAPDIAKATSAYASAINLKLAGDRRGAAWTSLISASKLATAEAPEEALTFYSRSVDLYRRLRDPQLQFHALNDRALCHIQSGDLAAAVKDLRSARRIGVRYQDRVMLTQSELNLGEIFRRQGRTAAAVSILRSSASNAASIQNPKAQSEALGNLGLTLVQRGEVDEAEALLLRAIELADAVNDKASRALALGGLGGVAMHGGDMRSAASYYRAAARVEAKLDSAKHHAESLGGLCEALAAMGVARSQFSSEFQRLVDVCQAGGAEDVGSRAALRASRWFLHRSDLETGASVLAVATTLAGTRLGDEEGQEFGRTVLEAAYYWLVHVPSESDAFEPLVAAALDELEPRLGGAMRPWLRSAMEHASQIPVRRTRALWAIRVARVGKWESVRSAQRHRI